MFQRLFVLLLLVAATVSVSTPAHASTLTVNSMVCESYAGAFSCEAFVSGGTGTYTSYRWGVATGTQVSYYTTTDPYFSRRCMIGSRYSLNVRVTDSAGATASATSGIYCTNM